MSGIILLLTGNTISWHTFQSMFHEPIKLSELSEVLALVTEIYAINPLNAHTLLGNRA